MTQHNLIDARPTALRDLQQLLREIPHKEPRDRFLRTMHQDPDAAIREHEAVLGRRFGPFAAGLDEDGSVEVREGPGGRFYAKISTSAISFKAKSRDGREKSRLVLN